MSRAIGVPIIVIVAMLRWSQRCSRNTGCAGNDGSAPTPSSTSSAMPRSGWPCCCIATPLIFGTLGVLLCERAGVLNLGIEGIMVCRAFAGWLTVYAADRCGWACWLRRSPAPRSACCMRG